MKIKNHLFWVCLAGTVFLAIGVIFLPRYISRSLDMRSLDRVEVSRREDFSFLEPSSNDVLEAVRAFRYLRQNGENPILITEIQDPIQMNSELLDQVYNQADMASAMGMIPWLRFSDIDYEMSGKIYDSYAGQVYDSYTGTYISWIDCAKFARYYSLTYESRENPNKKEILNFWYLRFSDDVHFDYYFIVNAVTFQLYYAEIYNVDSNMTAEAMERMYEERQFLNKEGYEDVVIEERRSYSSYFAEGCANYYEATTYDYAGSETLHEKFGIAILRYEGSEGGTVYVEQSVTEETHLDGGFQGIRTGFQELVNWVRLLSE